MSYTDRKIALKETTAEIQKTSHPISKLKLIENESTLFRTWL
jgi:hypothetical protein